LSLLPIPITGNINPSFEKGFLRVIPISAIIKTIIELVKEEGSVDKWLEDLEQTGMSVYMGNKDEIDSALNKAKSTKGFIVATYTLVVPENKVMVVCTKNSELDNYKVSKPTMRHIYLWMVSMLKVG